MSEANAVAHRLRDFVGRIAADPSSSRTSYHTLADGFILPTDVSHRPVMAGGVPGEQVTTPESRTNLMLLYLHGGAYLTGDAASYRHLTAELARLTRATVLAIDYRLAPEHPFPAAIDDTVAAYRSLLDAGVVPGSILLAGDSAGGGLALALMLTLRKLGLPQPAAAWLISPLADMAGSDDIAILKAEVDPLAVPAQVRAASFAAYLAGAPVDDPRASPALADLHGLPPIRIDVGSHEALIGDALAVARRAALADVDVTLQIWAEMVHIFPYFGPILRQGREAIAAAADFLTGHVAEGP